MPFLIGGRSLAALLSLAIGSLLTVQAYAQSGMASLAWKQFTAANAGWTAEWSATGDHAKSLRGLSALSSEDAARIAQSFISANVAVLGVGGSDVKLAHRVFDGTDTHISYQQSIGGLPVFNGFVDVHVNGTGQIYLVNNTVTSSVQAKAYSLRPALSAAAALQAAQGARHIFTDKRGLPYTLTLKARGQPELGFQQTDRGPRLAYKVNLGPATYIVDANTGALLDTINMVQSVDGIGAVFDPNPVNSLNNRALRDQNNTNFAALSRAYFSRKLLSITRRGSGAGPRYLLLGPFVRTINASNALLGSCGVAPAESIGLPPPQSPTARFKANRANAAFEHEMAYYHLDQSARYIHAIGFPTLWSRPIRVDAHALVVDNSFYCPSPVGAGFLAFGDGGVDDAEDADVILHEFGHAIQDASAPGRFSAVGETGSMGEGFGDYWAFSANVFGPWAPCFADWDSEGACLRRLDLNKKFPRDFINEVHADGEIWSRALRDLLLRLRKIKADRLILKSHFLISANPTFSDGLQAILNADHQLFGDRDKAVICAVFRDRGIGAPGC